MFSNKNLIEKIEKIGHDIYNLSSQIYSLTKIYPLMDKYNDLNNNLKSLERKLEEKFSEKCKCCNGTGKCKSNGK
ncbi:MAG: hypothetical protein ACYC6W_10895 [Nitrosotalea sp.]